MNDSESGSGCGKTLLGCGIFLGVSILILIIGGYVVMFHTALPAKGIVALLNKAPEIQIDGVSGSISSGFGVEKIRLTDADGNVNSLDDARLHYDHDGNTFTITDLHVGSGYFYVNSSDTTGEIYSTTGEDDGSFSTTTSSGGGGEEFNFIIAKASINNVTVEDLGTGEIFKLEGIQLENFEVGENFNLGKFTVDSSTCQLSVIPDPGKANSYDVSGRIETDFHETVLAPITLSGTVTGKDKKSMTVDLETMGGTIAVRAEGENTFEMTTKDLNPGDYLAKIPPITKLNLTISGKKTKGSAKGDFLFGQAPFVIDQQVETPEDTDAPSPPLIATHTAAGTTYTLTATEAEGKAMGDLTLTTAPEMPQDKALAQLLFGKAPDALSTEEAERLKEVTELLTK